MAKKLEITGAGRSDLHKIPLSSLSEIEVQTWNPRQNIGETPEDAELFEYVHAGGYLPPLLVCECDRKTVLVDGHRRVWALLKSLKIGTDRKEVYLVKTSQKNLNAGQMLLMALASGNGRQLTKTEKAAAVARLMELGWKTKEIASKIGVSESKVRDLAKLDTLIPELKEEVDAGRLPETEARRIATESGGDIEKQEDAFLNVEEEKENGKRTQTGRKTYIPVGAEVEEARIAAYERVLVFIEKEMKPHETENVVLFKEFETIHKHLNEELKRFIKKQEKALK